MLWESILPGELNRLAGLAGEAQSAIQLPMDNDAFAGFYERSARSLWAYLARVSGDAALADDLVQESYVRFLCAAGSPKVADGEIASRRYLFRIATNLLRDHWRRPKSASIGEIPEVTGVATASIRLLLFRARHKIAHLLRNPMQTAPKQAANEMNHLNAG